MPTSTHNIDHRSPHACDRLRAIARELVAPGKSAQELRAHAEALRDLLES